MLWGSQGWAFRNTHSPCMQLPDVIDILSQTGNCGGFAASVAGLSVEFTEGTAGILGGTPSLGVGTPEMPGFSAWRKDGKTLRASLRLQVTPRWFLWWFLWGTLLWPGIFGGLLGHSRHTRRDILGPPSSTGLFVGFSRTCGTSGEESEEHG